jgi:glycosyltransferase involved in cell wall biosynthesis
MQAHIIALKENYSSINIIVLTFQYPFFVGTYKWNDIDVISFGGEEKGKVRRLLLWTRVWNVLKGLQKETNILGLFSFWCTECALIGSYFGKRYQLKHFTWLCGQDAKKENKYVRLVRPTPGALIAQSDFLKREFHKNHGVEPLHVIPLGVEPSHFAIRDTQRDIDVLGVGSLIPLKQYGVFVSVVENVKKSIPGISAMICGKGPEKKKLIATIAGHNLQDNLALTGELPRSEILGLMQRTKVFVHTSNYEGFGAVCIEALYAGAHVVSFTKPMDTAIAHWHHVKDEKEMAEKIIALLTAGTISHEPILPYTTTSIANNIMALFS